MISPSLQIDVATEIFSKKIKMNRRLLKFIQVQAKKQIEEKRMKMHIPDEKLLANQIERSILDAIVKKMTTDLAEPDVVIIE